MVDEVVRELITDPAGIYLDATVGGGGHAEVISDRLSGAGCLIGFDRDPGALALAQTRLSRFGDRVRFVHADYRNLASILHDLGITAIKGALFDLGLSSLQLDDPGRGFSYRWDSPLDLRFDTTSGPTAADWLRETDEEEIARVLRDFGGERHARRLARAIVRERRGPNGAIETTGQLVRVIDRVIGEDRHSRGRSAARVFQALRIVVNDELAAIPVAIPAALDLLSDGGRLVVLAYHSGEDGLVKSILREAARTCHCARRVGPCVCGANPRGWLVYRKPLRPTAHEESDNPRAKAARLRVFERAQGLSGRES